MWGQTLSAISPQQAQGVDFDLARSRQGSECSECSVWSSFSVASHWQALSQRFKSPWPLGRSQTLMPDETDSSRPLEMQR